MKTKRREDNASLVCLLHHLQQVKLHICSSADVQHARLQMYFYFITLLYESQRETESLGLDFTNLVDVHNPETPFFLFKKCHQWMLLSMWKIP